MPHNVRNFWLTLNVDGQRTNVETGPRAADGGFTLTIRQRNQGGIAADPVVIHGRFDNGRLTIEANIPNKSTPVVLNQTTR